MDFITELLHGDEKDKGYQKKIIDNLVNKVFVSDKKTEVFFYIKCGKDTNQCLLTM